MRVIVLAVAFAVLLLCAPASAEEGFLGAPVEPPAGRVISGWGQFSGAWDLGQANGKSEADDLAAYEKVSRPMRRR